MDDGKVGLYSLLMLPPVLSPLIVPSNHQTNASFEQIEPLGVQQFSSISHKNRTTPLLRIPKWNNRAESVPVGKRPTNLIPTVEATNLQLNRLDERT